MEAKLQMIYWKNDKFWVGKLLEHPEIMTQGETLEELVDAFNKTNEWGITVETQYMGNYDQMFGQVSAALEQGHTPNIVLAYHYQALSWDTSLQPLLSRQLRNHKKCCFFQVCHPRW